MTDPLRVDRPSTPGEVPDRERDARIEDLLLTGLDYYFTGEYDLAINVWTRVLFLDRGHARARAYIERARGAISERLREGDELFHTGAAALMRGDRAEARELLTSAVDRAGHGEEALALLHRLDRLEVASRHADRRKIAIGTAAAKPAAAHARTGGRETRLLWVAGGVFVGILATALVAGYLWIVVDPFGIGTPRAALPPVLEDPLTVPTAAEVRLQRARTLVANGRPHEALALLEAAPFDDPDRAGVDALRAAIQRQLLESARRPSPGTPSQPSPSR